MATLDITLHGVTANSTISIRVKLNGVEKSPTRTGKSDSGVAGRRLNQSSGGNKRRTTVAKGDSAHSAVRLLPSDRLVLYSLRARLPADATETPPIRIRDLMSECSISRRQVGICLRRLNEKGMISRVGEGSLSGRTEGYRYRILKPS
jgi:hypothetical protein